jgi:excisionase family DNA binding protein
LDREAQAKMQRYTSPSKLMTVREVCDYLRVSRKTIYRLLKENQIPAFRLGSDWRFNIEQIDGWRLGQTLGE